MTEASNDKIPRDEWALAVQLQQSSLPWRKQARRLRRAANRDLWWQARRTAAWKKRKAAKALADLKLLSSVAVP